MGTPTALTLPDALPYPITITNLLAQPGDTLARGAALCDYSFVYTYPAHVPAPSASSSSSKSPERKTEKRYGRWECPIDGVLDKWLIRKGVTIRSVEQARSEPAAMLLEDCPHSTQIHGLCALCGKDMTSIDYLGSNASRATIRMTHDADGPTVSMSEAMRYDQETSQRLLTERKLSLIVDLDQTIIHATVDPTVGEWMDEANEFERKRRAKAEKTEPKEGEETTEKGDVDEEEEENPNWAALSDVKRFKLGNEGPHPAAGAQEDGSYYYIKPRPGLTEFLETLKARYEMHVYTMGTRAYAIEVCRAIDPSQSIFGERVLTRDESGSMTSKNLQRLFPSDQSMVAIIDDRSDVWSDVPNLVKVNPYDFFVGIGDINSAHLPPVLAPPGSVPVPGVPGVSPPPLASLASAAATTLPSTTPPSTATLSSTSTPPTAPLPLPLPLELSPTDEEGLGADKDQQDRAITRAREQILETLVHERPLAKMQEALDLEGEEEDEREEQEKAKQEAEAETEAGTGNKGEVATTNATAPDAEVVQDGSDPDLNPATTTNGSSEPALDTPLQPHPQPHPHPHPHPHKVKHRMLLHNNDNELLRLEDILVGVHQRFYDAYDASDAAKGKALRTTDVRSFITARKAETFAGLHFAFSNVFPTNQDPKTQPIWRQAEKYGAQCYPSWNESITHVIALKLRSEKTERAARKPNTFVVHPQWLWECIAHWERVPEQPYVDMLKVLDAALARSSSTVSSAPSAPPVDGAGAADTSGAGPSSAVAVPTITTTAPDGAFLAESSADVTPEMARDALIDTDSDEGDPAAAALSAGSPVDWAAVDDEVDAFLNETDDDDGDEDEDMENASDHSSTPSGSSRGPKKRRRSASVSSDEPRTPSLTGSPLSKRIKLSNSRRGQSGLKVEILKNSASSAASIQEDEEEDEEDENGSGSGLEIDGDSDKLEDDEDLEERAEDEELEEMNADMRDATDDEERDSEDDDDDFLARDIEFG